MCHIKYWLCAFSPKRCVKLASVHQMCPPRIDIPGRYNKIKVIIKVIEALTKIVGSANNAMCKFLFSSLLKWLVFIKCSDFSIP